MSTLFFLFSENLPIIKKEVFNEKKIKHISNQSKPKSSAVPGTAGTAVSPVTTASAASAGHAGSNGTAVSPVTTASAASAASAGHAGSNGTAGTAGTTETAGLAGTAASLLDRIVPGSLQLSAAHRHNTRNEKQKLDGGANPSVLIVTGKELMEVFVKMLEILNENKK